MINPKEKAEVLINEYEEYLSHIIIGTNNIEGLILSQAKGCAIICCEKLIDNSQELSYGEYGSVTYWQEVKNEIIKFKI